MSALEVCLGFPPFHEARYLERLRELEGVTPNVLPIDPQGEWVTYPQDRAIAEPPPWAASVAEPRREVLARADVLVALHAPARLSTLAPRLRWIQGAGAGMEQFADAAPATQGLVVTNASGVSSASMAEWVLGRLLQVWKRFREADAFQRDHDFERSYGRTLQGSTIGIVGLGNIGREVSQRVRAMGCRVLATRRSAVAGATSADADRLFPPERLHEMLGECDAVVLAMPSTPQTHRMIDAAALRAMRSDAVLVNVARGAVVDEAALIDALRAGELGGAVLDVFEREPLDPASALWDLPNVYVSAHSSVSVDRYADDVFDLFFDNLKRYLSGEELRNRVDPAALGF